MRSHFQNKTETRMDLRDAASLALSLIDQHLDKSWAFRWTTHKTRWGQCDYRRKNICLSSLLTLIASEDEVRDTVLHEIAHALTPGAKHGPIWKAAARRLGCRTEASYAGVGRLEAAKQVVALEPVWALVCGGELVKAYHRHPGKAFERSLPRRYLRSDPEGTRGKLRLVRFSDYKRFAGI
jgi:hypothetical protein